MRYHFARVPIVIDIVNAKAIAIVFIQKNKYTYLVTTTSEYAFDYIFMQFFLHFISSVFFSFRVFFLLLLAVCCVRYVWHSMVAKGVQSA